MKLFNLIIICSIISLFASAQDCSQVYTFNTADKNTYSTTCGLQEGNNWIVNKNSCNFYSPFISVGGNAGSPNKKIDIKLKLTNSGNLDSKDFAWIFYYVNGKIEVTKTIRGDQVESLVDFRDSVSIPSGGNFKLRIAFVCDEQDEFWKLSNGDLSICVRALSGEPVIQEASQTDKISLIRDRNIVKLSWYSVSAPGANYFLVERSKNGSQYEFAGYVKDNNSLNSESNYSFIDTGAFTSETWYRISQVDIKGKSQPYGAATSVK